MIYFSASFIIWTPLACKISWTRVYLPNSLHSFYGFSWPFFMLSSGYRRSFIIFWLPSRSSLVSCYLVGDFVFFFSLALLPPFCLRLSSRPKSTLHCTLLSLPYPKSFVTAIICQSVDYTSPVTTIVKKFEIQNNGKILWLSCVKNSFTVWFIQTLAKIFIIFFLITLEQFSLVSWCMNS